MVNMTGFNSKLKVSAAAVKIQSRRSPGERCPSRPPSAGVFQHCHQLPAGIHTSMINGMISGGTSLESTLLRPCELTSGEDSVRPPFSVID